MGKLTIERLLGYILITPALFSVAAFFITFFKPGFLDKNFLQTSWTGYLNWAVDGGGGGGFSSSLPIYFGLMAIAGAMLLKGGGRN